MVKYHFCLIILIGLSFQCASAPPEPNPEPLPEPVVEIIQESEPVIVPPPIPPKPVLMHSIAYDYDRMVIKWYSSKESNFKSYMLLKSNNKNLTVDTLFVGTNPKDTTFSLQEFDPTISNWFWVLVVNEYDLISEGNKSTHKLEDVSPESVTLYPIEFDNQLKLRWSKNNDDDFSHYEIYVSSSDEIQNQTLLDTLNDVKDTLFVIPMDSVYYYQIAVVDKWGLQSQSNVVKGDCIVELWDSEYSVINTREIDLSSAKLIGEIPTEIRYLLNLEVLKIQNNYLTGNFIEELCTLKNLRHINLSNNHLTGLIPASIHHLRNLEELWLSRNQFYGELPFQIFMLDNLNHLNLSENKIDGELSESISRLSNLEYLNLWDNNMSGLIPKDIGELDKLEFLSLGSNKFSGVIPTELGHAVSLRSVALFENSFTGTIPENLGALKNLEYLSLFDNELVGAIPDGLMRVLDLSYFKISNNKLDTISHESMCESGYDWTNSIYFDVSQNEFKDPPICFPTDEMREIQSSFLKK